jgi:hypothetical protein
MPKAVLIAAILALASSTAASAQIRGSAATFGARPSGSHFRASIVTAGPQFSHQHGRNSFPAGFFLGDTWLGDYSTSGVQSSPSVVVIEPESSAKETVAPPQPARNPLMIELQGNRYVRYDGSEPSPDSRTASISPERDILNPQSPLDPRKNGTRAAATELAPATLIFRDGREEQVTDYTIVSGIMYVHADYWTSGSWTKQIQLAALDLPATLKANQDRGVKFALPTAPNEVITRP